MPDVIHAGLIKTYQHLGERVADLAGPLTDEQFWRKPFAFGNSVGHLVLHLTGNLNYYIGAQMAQTGYVRDREREFTEASRPSKKEVIATFDRAVAMVVKAIETQSAGDWEKAYSAKGAESVENQFEMLVRCAAHMDHHVGQMQYLCNALR